MDKILAFFKELINRVIRHWQTTVVAILLWIAFSWFNKGKISFDELKTWVVTIGSILLMLMKDYNKKDGGVN